MRLPEQLAALVAADSPVDALPAAAVLAAATVALGKPDSTAFSRFARLYFEFAPVAACEQSEREQISRKTGPPSEVAEPNAPAAARSAVELRDSAFQTGQLKPVEPSEPAEPAGLAESELVELGILAVVVAVVVAAAADHPPDGEDASVQRAEQRRLALGAYASFEMIAAVVFVVEPYIVGDFAGPMRVIGCVRAREGVNVPRNDYTYTVNSRICTDVL